MNGTFGPTNTTINLNVSFTPFSFNFFLFNATFYLDEETGKCLDEWSISIYRRWNYENNIAAVVCHVGTTTDDHAAHAFSAQVFEETVRYTLQKLQQGHENDSTSIYNLKIFYPLNKNIRIEDEFLAMLEGLKESFCLVFTVVPVIGLKSENTYLSISGVRNQ